ncbi:ABC transporter substrate-binding protein, partial [Treponema sp.]|uniref:ABC transporter substrate-binding protein n=1 Tax=Treponema sp. TaxID=166 RepID=UPI0025DD7A8F
ECNITFSWWGKEDRCKYTLEGISDFEKKHPAIKVEPSYTSWNEYEKTFQEKLDSGQCADVMLINFDWLYKYSADGKSFYNLNELSDYIDLYNFTLDDLSFGTIEGKLNAIPVAFNTAIPVFDMDVLEKYSLKIPSTWDELFEMAAELKKHDMYVFTISKRHLFFLTLAWFEQTYSQRIFNDDGSLNIGRDELIIILDFVKKLDDENVIYSLNDGIQLNGLRENKIAGSVLWCNETSVFIKEVSELGGRPVLGDFITKPDSVESGWYLKPASMYAIKKDCKYPRQAAMLVDYLLNDRDFALMQKNDKGVPVSNKAFTALMEEKKLESMQYTALMKIRFNSANINKMLPFMDDNSLILSFSDNAYAYVTGRKSSADAASELLEVAR